MALSYVFTRQSLSSYLTYGYLGLLYFLEGVPYGMQDKLLPQYLRSENFSYGKVALARILLVPWVCKPLYASYIEQRWTQKRWLQTFLTLLTAVTCFISFLDQSTTALVASLLIVNILSACLDVSVDSVAMDLLHGSQLAMGNAIQVGGYKVGAIFGGGVLLFLQVSYGFKGVLQGLCIMYSLGLVVVTLWKHTSNEKELEKSGKIDGVRKTTTREKRSGTPSDKGGDGSVDDSADLKRYGILQRLRWAISVEGTWGLLVFLALYKSGEYGMVTTYPSFLLDRGHSYAVIGVLNGFVAQIISLLGTLSGVPLSRNLRKNKSNLFWLCVARLVPSSIIVATNMGFLSAAADMYVGVASLLLLSAISGMITTIAFTMMMACSQKTPRGFKSTHFSLLCTVEVLGKLAFSVLVGPLVDTLGKAPTHFAMTLLMGASVATVSFLT
ncbi:major facilitator superfamily domain-containing protein 3-like [Ornithodoros turicata]|uniref:major facilitator superfamily domain-containing protein 3-like n=1 Tax=Ornithodoros turicata TaxID=34597 RepID=UPI003138FD0A